MLDDICAPVICAFRPLGIQLRKRGIEYHNLLLTAKFDTDTKIFQKKKKRSFDRKKVQKIQCFLIFD